MRKEVVKEFYCVWKVYYGTYDEIAIVGDKKPVRVSHPVGYNAALTLLETFFGADDYRFCIKPLES